MSFVKIILPLTLEHKYSKIGSNGRNFYGWNHQYMLIVTWHPKSRKSVCKQEEGSAEKLIMPAIWKVTLYVCPLGLPRWLSVKESACKCRGCWLDPWVRKIPCWRKWQPTPVLLPGKSQGQRGLVGYSPWGCKIGMTWWLKEQNIVEVWVEWWSYQEEASLLVQMKLHPLHFSRVDRGMGTFGMALYLYSFPVT